MIDKHSAVRRTNFESNTEISVLWHADEVAWHDFRGPLEFVGRNRSGAFLDCHHAIGFDVVKFVSPRAGPFDDDLLSIGVRPQAKADDRLARRGVSYAGGRVVEKASPVRQGYFDFGPHTIVVASAACQFECEPVSGGPRDVV